MMIKKTLLTTAVACAAFTMSAAAMAASDSFFNGENAGFVVGIQGGYADLHWDDRFSNPANNTSGVKDTGFAARGFVGFDFNKYLGVETGYTYLPNTTFNGIPSENAEIKSYAIDLLAKLSVPVTNVFSVYAKAGGSYLSSKVDASIPGVFTGSETNTHIGPAFGVGAAYEVVPNLAIDLSWMRFSGDSRINHTPATYQSSPDVVLLGLSYKFPVHYT